MKIEYQKHCEKSKRCVRLFLTDPADEKLLEIEKMGWTVYFIENASNTASKVYLIHLESFTVARGVAGRLMDHPDVNPMSLITLLHQYDYEVSFDVTYFRSDGRAVRLFTSNNPSDLAYVLEVTDMAGRDSMGFSKFEDAQRIFIDVFLGSDLQAS